MIGKSITPPGKDAKPEDWDRFYSRLGRPKVAEDYSFDPVEGFEAEPSFMGKLKATFHSAGMTPAQAKHVFGLLAEESTASQATFRERNAQQVAAAETALRQEWGTSYENNVALAVRYADEVGGKDAVKRLEELGVASDPLILKLLSRAGQATNGRPLVKGSAAPGKGSPYGYMNEDQQSLYPRRSPKGQGPPGQAPSPHRPVHRPAAPRRGRLLDRGQRRNVPRDPESHLPPLGSEDQDQQGLHPRRRRHGTRQGAADLPGLALRARQTPLARSVRHRRLARPKGTGPHPGDALQLEPPLLHRRRGRL
jgi:hypothetical protein